MTARVGRTTWEAISRVFSHLQKPLESAETQRAASWEQIDCNHGAGISTIYHFNLLYKLIFYTGCFINF